MRASAVGVYAYQTVWLPPQKGSSSAVVASAVEMVSVNGSALTAFALSKSSFDGGAASADGAIASTAVIVHASAAAPVRTLDLMREPSCRNSPVTKPGRPDEFLGHRDSRCTAFGARTLHDLRTYLCALDRKSTRLNSSHANISYAV